MGSLLLLSIFSFLVIIAQTVQDVAKYIKDLKYDMEIITLFLPIGGSDTTLLRILRIQDRI